MSDDHDPPEPLREAGARLRAVVESKKVRAYELLEKERNCGGPEAERETSRLTGRVQAFSEILRELDALLSAPVVSPPDDVTRCSICGWTLADSVDKGCVRGNCSMRPLPERAYAPERANVEYGGTLSGRYGIPAAPVVTQEGE